MFGIDRLLTIIRDGYRLPLRDLMAGIERELARFRGEARFDDDISLLALEQRRGA